MSGGADNLRPAVPGTAAPSPAAVPAGSGGGAVTGGSGAAGVGATGSLLVVVEPPNDRDGKAGGGDLGGAIGATGPVLIAEGARLARKLGAAPRLVTWPAGGEADLQPVAEALAVVVERMRPRAVILADTDIGRQLAPMVAHSLDSGAIVGCSHVRVRRGAGGVDAGEGREARGTASITEQGALTFVKPVFGGWLEREIEPAARVVPVVTLDLAQMEEPDSLPDGLAALEVLEIHPMVEPRVRRLEVIAPDARSVDLVHAKRIVAAGAGSVSDDLLAAVSELAELLEGSVGTTRPVVDDGLLPKERLIGQTGRNVTPELYLALGISGSPHHMAGVRKADRILSVNRDARAPIFQLSDVGYVADLELVLPGLVQKIKEWRDAPESSE